MANFFHASLTAMIVPSVLMMTTVADRTLIKLESGHVCWAVLFDIVNPDVISTQSTKSSKGRWSMAKCQFYIDDIFYLNHMENQKDKHKLVGNNLLFWKKYTYC